MTWADLTPSDKSGALQRLQAAQGLTQQAYQATVVATEQGAKAAAESRVSSGVVPPQQYRMPPGTAAATLADSALPPIFPDSPTPAEAAAAARAAAAQKAQEAQDRAAHQSAAAGRAAAAEPPGQNASAEQPPGQPPPEQPQRPYRIAQNRNPTVHPEPTPKVSTSLLLARQQWLGYLNHRLPPPPPPNLGMGHY